MFAAFEDPSRRQDAVNIVERLVDTGGLSTAPVVEITLWALLEEGERAMSVARRLKTEGELFEAELMFIPQFAVLRQHPEFPDLMESIGLTEYWANVGCEFRDGAVVCDQDEAGFATAPD